MNKLLMEPTIERLPQRSVRHFLRTRAHREALRVANPLRSALPFLAISLSLGALVVLFTLYAPCYSMSLNGVQVGSVQSRSMVAETITQVEGQVEQILGRDYTLEPAMSFHLSFTPKTELLSYSRVTDALYDTVPEIKSAYVLSVDGTELGVTADKQTLDAVLNKLETPFVNEQTKAVSFANDTRITRKYVPTEERFSTDAQLLQSLQQPVAADTVYEVRSGDTTQSVATQHGMSQELLLSKNPKLATQSSLVAGQIITVQKTLPLLSVCTTEEVTYTKRIPAPLREQVDANLYEDQRQVLSQGSDGMEEIHSNMSYVNGEWQYEEVLAQSTVQAPVETLVAVGTKERPSFYSTGSLQWPTQGRITSPFGYRSIFGGTSFHSGMDIANGYGTPIYAADSGVVTFAGYKGSYGNLIIIDHGNGWETYYSHSATNDVVVGQGVTKGDYIASMGATGRATGKHCHFEVRIQGEPVNPANYLP